MVADFWLNHWLVNARLHHLSLDRVYGSILSSYWVLKGRLLINLYKIMKLYYHKTDGGAEYLCSNNVRETNEGSFDSKYIVRIDRNVETDKTDGELTIRKNKEDNKEITIPLSEEDLEAIKNGEAFDWTFDYVNVHLKLETDTTSPKD